MKPTSATPYYHPWPPPTVYQRMPGRLKAARVLLFVVAALTVALAAGVGASGATSEEVGYHAGIPLILGIAGLVLALRVKPGRRGVRIGINIVETIWILVALGRIGNGDPTGAIALVLPVVLLTLVNGGAVGRYFARHHSAS